MPVVSSCDGVMAVEERLSAESGHDFGEILRSFWGTADISAYWHDRAR
jgi:hypothetical protein